METSIRELEERTEELATNQPEFRGLYISNTIALTELVGDWMDEDEECTEEDAIDEIFETAADHIGSIFSQ